MVAVVVAGGIVWELLQPSEPLYEGKSISYWLHHGMESANDGSFHVGGKLVGAVIVEHMPNFDSNALPYLVKTVKNRGSAFHAVATWSWNKLPARLQKRFDKPLPASALRLRALVMLGHLQAEALPAVPDLIRVLKSDDDATVRLMTVDCLAQIDRQNPQVREALTAAALDKDRTVRAEAILQLQGTYNSPVDRVWEF